MVLYGLRSCDTCRKAMKLLENVEFRDVRADGVPAAVKARALEKFGANLLNRRSTTWRGLSEAERAQPIETLLDAYPTLMKRPLIEAERQLYLGWSDQVRAELLG